jgi:hypothetical protein
MLRKLFVICLALLLFVTVLAGCDDDKSHENEAKVPSSSKDFKGENYQDVTTQLESAGFSHIETVVLDDLITGWLTKDGEVEEVSINGDTDYDAGSWFAKDALIKITYHTFPQEEKTSDDGAQAIYNDAIGKPAIDIKNELEKLGYAVTFTHAVTKADFSGEVFPAGDEFYIPWIITDLDSYDASSKTASFFINTQELIDEAQNKASVEKASVEDALQAKLDYQYAWQAVESYGKEYSYGFKLHWMAGRLAQTARDENTWFLKATCDVRNEYGTWVEDLTCEALVSGTTESPKIVDFKVY